MIKCIESNVSKLCNCLLYALIALIDLLIVTNIVWFELQMDVSPLITKNRNPLNSAHNWANIIEWKSFKNHFSGGSRCNTMDGYGRRATDPRLNVVIRTLRRQHRCFTTESVLWPNNPIIGGWAVLFTPWKYIFTLTWNLVGVSYFSHPLLSIFEVSSFLTSSPLHIWGLWNRFSLHFQVSISR